MEVQRENMYIYFWIGTQQCYGIFNVYTEIRKIKWTTTFGQVLKIWRSFDKYEISKYDLMLETYYSCHLLGPHDSIYKLGMFQVLQGGGHPLSMTPMGMLRLL